MFGVFGITMAAVFGITLIVVLTNSLSFCSREVSEPCYPFLVSCVALKCCVVAISCSVNCLGKRVASRILMFWGENTFSHILCYTFVNFVCEVF